jgi:hypothetical protein
MGLNIMAFAENKRDVATATQTELIASTLSVKGSKSMLLAKGIPHNTSLFLLTLSLSSLREPARDATMGRGEVDNRWEDHQRSLILQLMAWVSAGSGMYPPPHMTCLYPPPHMAWYRQEAASLRVIRDQFGSEGREVMDGE